MQSIKTNFALPLGTDPIKQAARTAQDLSSNFKAMDNFIKSFGTNFSLACLLPVGSVLQASLTLKQMQETSGTEWVLTNGAQVKGSMYSNITGNTTVPTIVGSGTVNVFIKIN